MSKHTPGPWKVDGTYIYEVEQDKIIAEVETYNNDELPYQANARLMAAAPELLEFVKSLMLISARPTRGYIEWILDTVKGARELIAKIEGDVAAT